MLEFLTSYASAASALHVFWDWFYPLD